ncbi:oxidoreductase, partial [Candidatus Bathyarchaeota archaeon]|nr:oxidoreductase [Candidatus Bathyarchaeota archaeon]
ALNLKESDEMISICRENRVVLQIGFMRRFDKAFQQAKRMVEEGKIGKIAIIKSTGRGPGLPPKWACDPKKSLGMLAEVNSHDFDSIRWFGGSDFSRVYAEADTFKCFELKNEYPNFYDNSIVSIRLKNGTLALLDGSCPVEYGYDARVEILGTEGVIMIGDIKDEMISACTKKGGGVTYPAFLSWRDRFRGAYIEEIKHFINCVLENRKPMVSGEDGKKAVEAVLAATKSLLTQKPVEMPLRDDPHF